MEDIFIKSIKITQVRNLTDFEIPISEDKKLNLIITGKNGSGKTSLLEGLVYALQQKQGAVVDNLGIGNHLALVLTGDIPTFRANRTSGKFIMAYYRAKREAKFQIPKGASKINLSPNFGLTSGPGNVFLQYLVNLRMDRLEAKESNDKSTEAKIAAWFEVFEERLNELIGSPNAEFRYNPKNYNFEIVEPGKQPYSLDQLSDGYGAVLNIVADLIMHAPSQELDKFDLPGIVLIDEIETHLHVDLQKAILPFLTSFFPKIQFIVTTHSPFVINSIKDAVICDLEKRIVTTDLTGYSYDTLIESYFDSDKYSTELKERVDEYEHLLNQDAHTEAETDRLFELKQYLKEIPKFASDELAVKLQQLKLKEMDKRKAK